MQLLALLMLVLPPATVAPEVLTETLPDGTYVEREIERGPHGEAINHGGYKEWWDDTKAVPRVRGRFEHGLATATWRTYHANERIESKGRYEDGFRVGPWDFRHEDGTVDEERSGEFTVTSCTRPDGGTYARGELKDGVRSGHWIFNWPNGVTLAEGDLLAGRLQGPWVFRHPDGTIDPSWITGVYADGERRDDLDLAQARRLAALPSEGEPGDVLPDAVLLLGAEVEPAKALAELLALDLADPQGAATGERLVGELAAGAGGAAFAWHSGNAPADVAANRLTVLRWTSFWTLLARDPDYASFDYADRLAALERVDGRPALEHLHPPFQGGGFDGALDLGPLAGRLAERRPELGAGTGAALDAALDWLARHQEEDGSWSPGGFWMRCASEPRCEGPGSYGLDVGVSALALLAFLGNGDTTVAGPHQRQVQRGIVWLLGEQDADSGRFGRSSGPSQVYEHAIATLAIGEAAAFSGHRVLRDAARRGIAVIQAARNPQAAWRYGFAPDGSDDTSVTAWMVQALDAGRRVGLEVDEQCFQGALSWLDEATQPENGRCGYDATGTLSARVSGSNDQYPPENGEALTGAALFLRSLIGQRAESTPLLEQHAELLLQKLPEWNPEGLTCDMYYWYYGSMGLRQLGGSSFAAWADALAPAALGGQRQDGDAAGSWDPVGPWGFSGGRVYATAMMALCLEAPYRFAPPAEAQGSTKKR